MSQIQKINPSSVTNITTGPTKEQVELWKRTYCKGSTNDELMLFINACKRTGLDPEQNQIYAIKRWDSSVGREVLRPQTSIDGFRLIASRTGKLRGYLDPTWSPDGREWFDAWGFDEMPLAAAAGCYHADYQHAVRCVAHWKEFAQKKKNGDLKGSWATIPIYMLAKCSESHALRKAFPNELSGLYTEEEMGTDISQANHRQQQNTQPQGQQPALATNAQLSRMFAILKKSHASRDDLKGFIQTAFGIQSTKEMNMQQYNQTVDWITKFPEKKSVAEEVIEEGNVIEAEEVKAKEAQTEKEIITQEEDLQVADELDIKF